MAAIHNVLSGSGGQRLTKTITISSDVFNYSLSPTTVASDSTSPGPGYLPGLTDVIFTIESGIVISANSTSLYALTVDSAFSPYDTVTVINNGYIIGQGGNGANSGSGANGSAGGPALRLLRSASITNNSVIGGGGGGGGYGSGYGSGGGGGGGRTGRQVSYTGSGGRSGETPYGTFSGPAVPNNTPGAGTGGPGGQWGSSGVMGENYGGSDATYGGAGGAAVVGNSFATWLVTGTRYGSLT